MNVTRGDGGEFGMSVEIPFAVPTESPRQSIYVLSGKPEHRTTPRQQIQLAVSDAAMISNEPRAITYMVYVGPGGSSTGKTEVRLVA